MAATVAAVTAVTAGSGLIAPAAAVAKNGRLAFPNASNLVLQPLTGAPSVIKDRRATIIGSSRSGRLMALSSGTDGDVTIADGRGRVIRRIDFRGIVIHSLDISPDGRRLALTAFRDAEPGRLNLFPYVADISGRGLTRVTTRLRHTFDLRFTRDGRAFVYAGAPTTGDFVACPSLRRVRLDGTRDTLLYEAVGGTLPCALSFALSPAGNSAVFTGDPAPGQLPPPGTLVRTGVYQVALTGRATPRLLHPQAFAVAWAPDGDQVAFSSLAGTYRMRAGGGTATRVSPTPTLAMTWLKAAG
ncbi:hypothetical protein [Paraconexibacter sp. AEG42_29]|uniref:hypothetical protein n=1 Tax=Paraconexibacter sp. AEG42_29 TaxID=2997339 RepID=UPI00339D353E